MKPRFGRITPTLDATLLASLAFVAFSCKGAVDAPLDTTPPVISLKTPVVWAGGQIVLTVSGVSGADTLPVVLLGDDTAAARFAAPDSLLVAAPDTQGTFDLRLSFRSGDPQAAGAVRLEGGYTGWSNVNQIGGIPLPWPGGGVPSFLVAQSHYDSPGYSQVGLALVDPRVGTAVTKLPDSVFSQTCINGPGPTTDGRVVVRGLAGAACGPLVAVRPDSPWVARDTGPTTSPRFAVKLGSRWLVAAHHSVAFYSGSPAAGWSSTSYWLEEPYAVALAPRGDRAVVVGRDNAGLGIPVYAPTSDGPAYMLTSFKDLWGAQFSDNSDTLYVVGVPTGGTSASPILAAVSSADGTVLRSASAWPYTMNLVLDPGRPWLFLVGYAYGGPVVQVVDRATLATVATLAGKGPTSGWMPSVPYPVLSVAERKLYLVDTCSFCLDIGSPPIFAFDLMP